MKILYAGTPEIAVAPLNALAASEEVEVVGVLTREDAPVGRKRILSASAVAQRAEQLGIPVIKASQWSAQTAHAIASLGADAAAVVAYGALLPQEALKLLPHGWVNLHFSALPAYRGAAPVQRALMAGETTIYSNTFLIEEGLDTGPVFECDSTPVGDEDTAGSILNRLAETGGELLLRTFARIAEGQTGTPQTGEASYAHKMSIADGRLDFNEPAERVLATFRGVTPDSVLVGTHDRLRELHAIREGVASPVGRSSESIAASAGVRAGHVVRSGADSPLKGPDIGGTRRRNPRRGS